MDFGSYNLLDLRLEKIVTCQFDLPGIFSCLIRYECLYQSGRIPCGMPGYVRCGVNIQLDPGYPPRNAQHSNNKAVFRCQK